MNTSAPWCSEPPLHWAPPVPGLWLRRGAGSTLRGTKGRVSYEGGPWGKEPPVVDCWVPCYENRSHQSTGIIFRGNFHLSHRQLAASVERGWCRYRVATGGLPSCGCRECGMHCQRTPITANGVYTDLPCSAGAVHGSCTRTTHTQH